jgi:hypothetical protein
MERLSRADEDAQHINRGFAVIKPFAGRRVNMNKKRPANCRALHRIIKIGEAMLGH